MLKGKKLECDTFISLVKIIKHPYSHLSPCLLSTREVAIHSSKEGMKSCLNSHLFLTGYVKSLFATCHCLVVSYGF